MTHVKEEDALRDRALARGWISQDQFDSGASLSTLLSQEQIKLLEAEQFGPTQLVNEKMMNKLVEGGFLQGEDILEPVREKFGRYEIIKRVGEGGTGQVYLARDPKVDREVAIKILHRESMSTADRFHQEMEILAALNHPGIVTIYDAGVEEGQPYYAMEYVGEKSLQDLRCSLSESVEIVEAIAQACHAAHEKGVIHRDLKPANILMGDRPVVADFGIAKRQNAELTETGTVLGTPYYMSPEQALGKPVAVTTDVYSLGVILYELITGFRPFDGPSVAEISRKIVEVEPPAPRKRNQEIAPDLEVITQKAMAKEPERRYATAQALAQDLRAFKEGHPVKARRTSFAGRILLAAKRKPRVALGFGGAFLLAVVTLVLGLQLGTQPGEDPEAKRLREEAQQTIANERVAIQSWRTNLYLPPKRISYDPLLASVEKIGKALERKDLSPEVVSQGHLARARSFAFMGNMQEALVELDRSITAADSSEARLERVFILWESMFRERFLQGQSPKERSDQIVVDLQKAISLQFSDNWKEEFSRIILEVARDPNRENAQKAIESLEELGQHSKGPSEEIRKFIGDMYL
ncbi:MAG: serine/threonine-protein kinase, partial [Planctomycetota bacterium]|nr:serine/threonine-protein kinase [Planctomycetota bacterium]